MPPTITVAAPALSRRLVREARQFLNAPLAPELAAKVKTACLDLLSCAFEARALPPSLQAQEIASRSQGLGGGASVIAAPFRCSAGGAAFANATMAHGLVREDMHTGSVSHLGVVVLPALLALSESSDASGMDFLRAAVCGYEAGALIGRKLMDAETVRLHRPTGITGPLGAALAGSVLLGLPEDAAVSALGLAANTTSGLNEWPFSGADDMFFHAGFAARNAVTCVELAACGAVGSESALDGPAGLFASLGKDRHALADGVLFGGARAEILEVFHKPAPACNYAQTPCQAALAAVRRNGLRADDVTAIRVYVTAAALNYPGCNNPGPFSSRLQAKMSIHFGVAAAVARATLAESNYSDLRDPQILHLAQATTLELDTALTAAYPGRQGAEAVITTGLGQTFRHRMDDLSPAGEQQIRQRFRDSGNDALGPEATTALEQAIADLESLPRAGDLSRLLGAHARV